MKKIADPFYSTPKWKELRAWVVRHFNGVCCLCKEPNSNQVDHIKPRKQFPELALDSRNLRLLCYKCHAGLKSSFGRGGDHTHGKIRKRVSEDGFSDPKWR